MLAAATGRRSTGRGAAKRALAAGAAAGRLIGRRFIVAYMQGKDPARFWAKATVIEACYVIRYDWLLFLIEVHKCLLCLFD